MEELIIPLILLQTVDLGALAGGILTTLSNIFNWISQHEPPWVKRMLFYAAAFILVGMVVWFFNWNGTLCVPNPIVGFSWLGDNLCTPDIGIKKPWSHVIPHNQTLAASCAELQAMLANPPAQYGLAVDAASLVADAQCVYERTLQPDFDYYCYTSVINCMVTKEWNIFGIQFGSDICGYDTYLYSSSSYAYGAEKCNDLPLTACNGILVFASDAKSKNALDTSISGECYSKLIQNTTRTLASYCSSSGIKLNLTDKQSSLLESGKCDSITGFDWLNRDFILYGGIGIELIMFTLAHRPKR